MGHQTNIIAEAELVYASLYADVTPQDLMDLVNDMRSDPCFQPRFSEFVDLSHVSSFNVAGSQLAEIGRMCTQLFAADSKRVILAPSDLAFGMSRIFQIYAEQAGGNNILVVRTREEACTFLNIEEGRLPVPAYQ